MKVGRNDPCPCGSGKKYKKCCLAKDEAAERQSARERAAAMRVAAEIAAPTTVEPSLIPHPLPELTFPDEPPPLSPEEEAYQQLWDDFETAETEELPALFRRALSEALLDDELAFELLNSLRGQGEQTVAAALTDELRTARPDLYTASAPYYLDWQVEDALAAGRRDMLATLADALAEAAGRDLDIFNVSSARLAYHGHLALLADLMRGAWPFVRASDNLVPWAYGRFAANGQQLTLLAYVERTAAPRADDPALLADLEFFGAVDHERLGEQIALLTGEEERPWQQAGRSEDDQINRLALRFMGELARGTGVSLSRAELARVALVNYIGMRQGGKLGQEARPPKVKGAKAPASTKRSANLLCPDQATLNRYVAQLLGPITPHYYEAVATLEFTPAWLGFLQAQELITAEQRAMALTDLRRLVADAAPIWAKRGADPVVGAAITAAWEQASR
jgi:hypothetical protein